MQGWRASKPSPALVVAFIALVVAMSGTAVAVSSKSGAKSAATQKECNLFNRDGSIKKNNDCGTTVVVCAPEKAKGSAYNGPVSPCSTSRIREVMAAELKTMKGVVTTKTLAPSAVTAKKIDGNAVTAPKIASAAVTNSSIANNSITSNLIVSRAITSGLLASNAVDSRALAFNSVTSSALADDSVDRNAISADAVGPAQVEDVHLGNLARNPGWTTTDENPTHYVVDAEGVVHLRGLLFRAIDAGPIAFQLPPGIRPHGQSDREIPVIGAGGGCGGVSKPVSAYIQGNGIPGVEGGVTFSPADCSYYHLDGISFVP